MLYYFHLYVEVGYFSVNLVRSYLSYDYKLFFKTHNTTSRYPDEGGNEHNDADNVVTQKTQYIIDINVFYNVPKSFYNILDSFFANTL